MIFLMPLLIIFFILLLISKLAGAAGVSWIAVFLPLIIFLCIFGISYAWGNAKKKIGRTPRSAPTKDDQK